MYKAHCYPNEIYLENCRTGKQNGEILCLSIDPRNHLNIEINKINQLPIIKPDKIYSFYIIFGIYTLLSGPYLAIVKDVQIIGNGPRNEKMYQIETIELISISNQLYKIFLNNSNDIEKRDEKKYIQMIYMIIKEKCFYFSYDYPLTLNMQENAYQDIKNIKLNTNSTNYSNITSSNSTTNNIKNKIYSESNIDFFFNETLVRKFIDTLNIGEHWIIPVICGYIKIIENCDMNGIQFNLLFISRKGKERIGTRFNVRGIDKEGNVANFIETEMIIIKSDHSILSFVQIRGSIPLYWEQLVTLKYMPRTQYAHSSLEESSMDWNELAFNRHFNKLIQKYGKISIINLIDKNGKSSIVRDQAQLGTAYYKYVKKYCQTIQNNNNNINNNLIHRTNSSQNIMHHTNSSQNILNKGTNSSSQNPSNISNPSSPISKRMGSNKSNNNNYKFILNTNDENNNMLQYIWYDFHHECKNMKWENLTYLMKEIDFIFQEQNIFQTDISGRPITRQKGVFRINCMDNLDRTNVIMSLFARRAILSAFNLYNPSTNNVLNSPYIQFEKDFKNVWADNADTISKLYAGTGALKTDFTRTGKRTIYGAIQDGKNSIIRYYLNNFNDGIKQDAYDLFVCNYIPDKQLDSPFTIQQYYTFPLFLMKLYIIYYSIRYIIKYIENILLNNNSNDHSSKGSFISFLILVIISYLILKKGKFRMIGRHLVCKPSFCSSGYGYIKKKKE